MSDDNGGERATGTQLLDRAVAILKLLGEAGTNGAKVSELADGLELTPSTAHRIISALERHELIEREPSTRRYRLGLSLFALGAQAADGAGFRKLCHPSLLRLAAESGDTVFLMARSGFNTVCVDRQAGSYMIASLTNNVGGHIPMGVGPASQAILAFLPANEAEVILAANSHLYAGYNELSAQDIKARLPQIREQGYAFDDGQLVEGISAIAMPILPHNREVVGTIAINMTSARLSAERMQRLLLLLRNEIAAIEKLINPLQATISNRIMA